MLSGAPPTACQRSRSTARRVAAFAAFRSHLSYLPTADRAPPTPGRDRGQHGRSRRALSHRRLSTVHSGPGTPTLARPSEGGTGSVARPVGSGRPTSKSETNLPVNVHTAIASGPSGELTKVPASAWRGHSRAGKRLRTGRSRPTCPPCGVSPPQQGHGRARGRRFARRGRCACFPGLNLWEYSPRPAGAVGLRDVAGEPLVGHTRGQIRARRRRQPHHRRRVDHRKGRVEASFGHRMRVSDTLQGAAGISAGGTATPDIEVTKDRPGPTVPQDLTTALAAAPKKIQNLRSAVTPTSRQGPSEEPTTGRGEHCQRRPKADPLLPIEY